MTPFTPYTFGDEAPTPIHELPRRGLLANPDSALRIVMR